MEETSTQLTVSVLAFPQLAHTFEDLFDLKTKPDLTLWIAKWFQFSEPQ